jgi:hypothetical protein
MKDMAKGEFYVTGFSAIPLKSSRRQKEHEAQLAAHQEWRAKHESSTAS